MCSEMPFWPEMQAGHPWFMNERQIANAHFDPCGKLEKSRIGKVLWCLNSLSFRPVYDCAIREARSIGFIDAIFHNERGFVTEGAVHSIFVRHGNV